MATATTSQTLRHQLEELAELEQRPWQAGEWERTNHADPPGPGWSARADAAAAAIAAGREEPAGHWIHARGDGYPLDVPGPFESEIGQGSTRFYIVPNHDRAAHVGTPSGYRQTVLHRGRAYSAFVSLHMYRLPSGEWCDWRPATEEDTTLEQRHGRVDSTLYGADDMPAGARSKVRAAIVEAFRTWAAEHPEAFEHARAVALNNAAYRRDREIATKAKELAELLEELEHIESGAENAPLY